MENQIEKYLKPLRETALKIIQNKHSVDKYAEELKEKANSGQFYAVNIFRILLDLLKNNKNLEQYKTSVIFSILDYISKTHASDKYLVYFYNFTIDCLSKDISNNFIIDEVINYLKLTRPPSPDTLSHYMTLNEQLIKKESIIGELRYRKIFNNNYRQFIRSINNDKEHQKEIISRIDKPLAYYYYIENNWTISIDFLSDVVIPEFAKCDIEIEDDEVFMAYTDILTNSNKGDEIRLNFAKLVQIMRNFLTKKEHIKLNNVIIKCYEVFSRPLITERSIKDFYQECVKDVQSKNKLLLKVYYFISKNLTNRKENLEVSEECYITLHEFVFKLFNILRYTDKKEYKSQTCCNDVKRHIILSLSTTMINHASKLTEKKIYSTKIEKYLQYYIDYSLVLYKDLDCSLKQEHILPDIITYVYKVLQDLLISNHLMPSNINIMAQIYRTLVNFYEKCSENIKMSLEHLINLGSLFINITYEKTSENSQIFAETILYPIILSLIDKKAVVNSSKNLLKMIFHLNDAVKILKYASVFEYVKKKIENSELLKYKNDINLEEFLVLELEAICRYGQQQQDDTYISGIFIKVANEVNDIGLIARACLTINDKIIKSLDLKKFKDLNDRLEEYEKNDIKVLLALMYNNYYLNFIEFENIETEIDGVLKESPDDIPGCINLENELKILSYLDKTLEYAMEILFHIKKNQESLKMIPSCKMLILMLENISTQYFLRGIANKDLEAKLVLWHFLQYDNNPEALIDVASFFIDNMDRLIGNSGHYICISKKLNYIKIEEIIPKANLAMEDLLENIKSKPESRQARPLNYMISLWTYYMLIGRRRDAREIYDRFESARRVCSLEKPLYVCTIDAKKLIALADVFVKCYRRNAVNYVHNAIILLQQIKSIYKDYSNNFQFIYRSIILKVINYSLNRLIDVEYYTTAMLTIKSQAIKKGLFVKTLDLYSISAFRNLCMEKLDDAKADLKKMTKMLQLNDNILIETPTSSKSKYQVSSIESNVPTLRDAAVTKNYKKRSVINIFNDSIDYSNELAEQIQTFVHEYTCKCSICKYPQMKFILFQMGCHYSRLFYLMGKLDISKKFNDHALEPWRYTSSKILRSKECVAFSIDKNDFIMFSIRWLFQVADTLIMSRNLSEVEDIYTEVELLCTSKINDYECIIESLRARIENLEFQIKFNDCFTTDFAVKKLDFNEFLKSREVHTKKSSEKAKKSTREIKAAGKTRTTSQQAPTKLDSKSSHKANLLKSVIYIDSDESDVEMPKVVESKKVAPKQTRLVKPKTADHIAETPRRQLKRL